MGEIIRNGESYSGSGKEEPSKFEPVIGSSPSGSSNEEWLAFCDINIFSTPADQPISFEFTTTGTDGVGTATLCFSDGTSLNDITINRFECNKYAPDMFAYKHGGGLWNIFMHRMSNNERTSSFQIKIGDYAKEKLSVTMVLEPDNFARAIAEENRIYAKHSDYSYMKNNSSNLVTGNIQLSPPDYNAGGYNTPTLSWIDSKRTVWSGIKNNGGTFYLWDGTNNRPIIISNLNGTGFVYGGTKATITTDNEGGNLRLFSPSSKVSGEIDCYDDKSTRWYAGDVTNNSIPCAITQSVENQAIIISCLKSLDLRAGVNYGVRVIDQSGGWGQISAADFNIASSRRYKKNVLPMTGERAKAILNVDVVTFEYNDGVVGKNQLDR